MAKITHVHARQGSWLAGLAIAIPDEGCCCSAWSGFEAGFYGITSSQCLSVDKVARKSILLAWRACGARWRCEVVTAVRRRGAFSTQYGGFWRS